MNWLLDSMKEGELQKGKWIQIDWKHKPKQKLNAMSIVQDEDAREKFRIIYRGRGGCGSQVLNTADGSIQAINWEERSQKRTRAERASEPKSE